MISECNIVLYFTMNMRTLTTKIECLAKIFTVIRFVSCRFFFDAQYTTIFMINKHINVIHRNVCRSSFEDLKRTNVFI